MATKKSAPEKKSAPTKKAEAPKAAKKAVADTPTREELKDAAADINTVLDLDVPIDLDLDREELIEAIKGVADEIVPKDQLVVTTWNVLEQLGVGPGMDKVHKAQQKAAAKEESSGAKGVKSTAKASKDAKAPKEKKAAKGGGLPKGPGIIAAIREFAIKNGKKGFTREQVLEHLVGKFPDRDADAMKKTVAVQVPNRLNNEVEELSLTKNDKGVYKNA